MIVNNRLLMNLIIFLVVGLINFGQVVSADAMEIMLDELTIMNAYSDDNANEKYPYNSLNSSYHLSNRGKAIQAANELIDYYAGIRPQYTDCSFLLNENGKPTFGCTVIRPIRIISKQAVFLQGHYDYQVGDSSASVGIGKRWMSKDKVSLEGVNFFYDYAFKFNHSRIGIGLEHFHNNAEYRVNFYVPLSGERETGVIHAVNGIYHYYERAVAGMDYEMGSSLAKIPWLKVYLGGVYFDCKHDDDIKGFKARATAQLSPKICIEAGYSNADSGIYGKINYQIGNIFEPTMIESQNPGKANVGSKMLHKVERENKIRTERYVIFEELANHVETLIVAVKGSGFAIEGALVQAYRDGIPIGPAIRTDALGIAKFSGLPQGMYSINVCYFGYQVNAGPIVISENQVPIVPVLLPIEGIGTALVNVSDQENRPVQDIEVICEPTASTSITNTQMNNALGLTKEGATEPGFSLSNRTNSQGEARFAKLPLGMYQFRVINQANGGVYQSDSVTIRKDETATVSILLGSPATKIGDLSFVVTSFSNPIEGVAVTFSIGDKTYSQITDAAGKVTFRDLPEGNYKVSFQHQDYELTTSDATVTAGKNNLLPISIAAKPGSYILSIIDGNNKAVQKVSVKTQRIGSALYYVDTSGINGKVASRALVPGAYKLTLSKTSYIDLVMEINILPNTRSELFAIMESGS